MIECNRCAKACHCWENPDHPCSHPSSDDQMRAMTKQIEGLLIQNAEMRKALEIAKPSTIHVLSGHVYGADDKLVEFVDGCARCRIEKILSEGAVKLNEVRPVEADCTCRCRAPETCPTHGVKRNQEGA